MLFGLSVLMVSSGSSHCPLQFIRARRLKSLRLRQFLSQVNDPVERRSQAAFGDVVAVSSSNKRASVETLSCFSRIACSLAGAEISFGLGS
jgi:hypothetical protein